MKKGPSGQATKKVGTMGMEECILGAVCLLLIQYAIGGGFREMWFFVVG